MIDEKYIIRDSRTVLEALRQINSLRTGPLVLFVVNAEGHMLGTLTDGDARRALIQGLSVEDTVASAMRKNFRFLRKGVDDDVEHLHQQRDMKMKLVPILDAVDNIVDIVNLDKYVTRLPIDAVLMAGGKGERLRPLTEKTPKPLLKVGEKAIIDHNIDRLISYGVQHISVTVNYLKDQLIEHFEEVRDGVRIKCVEEPKFLGTIGSIKFIPEFYNDTVLVMNSDLFTNFNYEDFYLHFKKHNADMSVAAVPFTVSVPYGVFDLDGQDIKGLVEKPTYNYYANAGIYLIKKTALEKVPDDTFFNATDLIEALIAENKKVVRFPLNGTWIDIGNPQEYQKANDLVKYIK